MFSTIKKQAKKLVLENYKTLILSSFFYMLSGMIIYLLFNKVITYNKWEDISYLVRFIMMLLLLLLVFICKPLSQVMFFKKALLIDCPDTKLIQNTLSPKTVKKIFIANFIPGILYLIIQAYKNSLFYYSFNDKRIAVIISLLGTVVNYMLFACNFYIAREKEHPIKESISLMKLKLGQYILFGFSFFGWFLIAALIRIGLQAVITGNFAPNSNVFLPYLDMFQSFGYGIGLFLWPYMYMSEYLLFNRWDSEKNKTGLKKSKDERSGAKQF